MRVIATILLVTGTALYLISARNLKNDLRFGLPEGKCVQIQIGGLYQFSRNPMYLAFALINFAAMIHLLHVILIIPSITSIFVHHLIILAEEHHLEAHHGEEYLRYVRAVRRYI